MLRGGPRGAVEALYVLQLQAADELRADMRVVLEELRAHHTHYQEIQTRRSSADHQILEAIAALSSIAKSLDGIARQADSMPDRVQAVLNSADVTEIHKKLADSLTLDVWAKLGMHSDAEARRFADIAGGLEKSVHAAIGTLRDASVGKPSLPILNTGGKAKERVLHRLRYWYTLLIRVSGDVHHLAVTFAAICVGLAAITIIIGQIVRATVGH